jgi:hypothetical protein
MRRPVYLRRQTFCKYLNRKPPCNRILAVSIIRGSMTRIPGYVLCRLTRKKNVLESIADLFEFLSYVLFHLPLYTRELGNYLISLYRTASEKVHNLKIRLKRPLNSMHFFWVKKKSGAQFG